MVGWLVHVIVSSEGAAGDQNWDAEFLRVSQNLNGVNDNLFKDAGEDEMLSDDNHSLRDLIKFFFDRG